MLNYFDWQLSPEQRMIQGVVREFVEREALPLIPDSFEKGEFPKQLIPRLGELGVLGPTIPQYGSGLDYTSYGLVCQELERGDSGLRSFVSVQGSLVMFPISSYGSEALKSCYLPGLHAGALIWARVAEDGQDTVRGFLVDTDRPGFTANEIKHKLSLRASVTSELVLQDVRVSASCMLPGVRGLRGPLSALNEARFGILFGVVGAAMA